MHRSCGACACGRSSYIKKHDLTMLAAQDDRTSRSRSYATRTLVDLRESYDVDLLSAQANVKFAVTASFRM